MASILPKAAPAARSAASQFIRAAASRRAASTSARSSPLALLQRSRLSLPNLRREQRRTAADTPHYDPAPKSIEFILKVQGAEPHTPEDWALIGQSALDQCQTQAERDEVTQYITNAMKPKLSDSEVIAASSQLGVELTTPEHVEAASRVFKETMMAASIDEARALFNYFEVTGDFPLDIKNALQLRLTEALAAPPAHAHDEHYEQHHEQHHAHGEGKEGFHAGFYWAVGAIPFSYILYTLTRSKSSDNAPFLTRIIQSYDHWREDWQRTNELHTMAVEQAGMDRLLFQHSSSTVNQGRGKMVARSTDGFNQGPQINVAPGHYINVDSVIEHYNKANAESVASQKQIAEYYAKKEEDAKVSEKAAGIFTS